MRHKLAAGGELDNDLKARDTEILCLVQAGKGNCVGCLLCPNSIQMVFFPQLNNALGGALRVREEGGVTVNSVLTISPFPHSGGPPDVHTLYCIFL